MNSQQWATWRRRVQVLTDHELLMLAELVRVEQQWRAIGCGTPVEAADGHR